MRILEANEVEQVSGAGLLGLNLNLGVLDILGIHAGVEAGGSDHDRSRKSNDCGGGDRGRSSCYGRDTRRRFC